MPSLKWLYFFFSIALGYFASIVFIPFFISIFSAILLEPFVAGIARRDISRHFATSLVIVLFFISLGAILYLGYLSLANLSVGFVKFPEKLNDISNLLEKITSKLDLSINANFLKSSQETIQKVQMVDPYPAWTGYFLRGMGSIYGLITVAVFVPLMLFYFLYDKDNLLESFNTLIGRFSYLPKLNQDLPKMIRTFVAANALTFIILFVGHGVVLYFLGFNMWLPLTLATAFVSLIPLIGAPLAIILPFTQGLSHGESAFPYIAMVLLFSCFHVVSNNLILPHFMGSRINVNTLSLIFGLLFWGWLWGPMGFVLAIPMTALVKIFLESNPQTVPLANLLAAKPRHILFDRKSKKGLTAPH
jgi:predicted PurR-regulated permease PerM